MKHIISSLIFALVAGGVSLGIGASTYKLSLPSAPVQEAPQQEESIINQIQTPVPKATENPTQQSGYRDDDDNEIDEDDGWSASPATQPTTQPATPPVQPSQPSTTSGGTGTKSFSAAQVSTHNTQASCWSSINGSVYDLTAWIAQHPGGEGAILSICGQDGSAAFNNQHGGSGSPARILQSYLIGVLQ